jgi:hypothetical protein
VQTRKAYFHTFRLPGGDWFDGISSAVDTRAATVLSASWRPCAPSYAAWEGVRPGMNKGRKRDSNGEKLLATEA